MVNMVKLDDVSVSKPLDDVDLLFCALVSPIEESLDHHLIETTLGFEDFSLSTMTDLFSQFKGVDLSRESAYRDG